MLKVEGHDLLPAIKLESFDRLVIFLPLQNIFEIPTLEDLSQRAEYGDDVHNVIFEWSQNYQNQKIWGKHDENVGDLELLVILTVYDDICKN